MRENDLDSLIDSVLYIERDFDKFRYLALTADALRAKISRVRQRIAVWCFQRFYQDLQDYITEEPNWTCEHNGVNLSFPINRERLFIVVNGQPIAAQEGCTSFVTTKRYQFASACSLSAAGHDVFSVHNHPGGNPDPSDLDMEVARVYPEIRHYTVAIQADGTIVKREYNESGVIDSFDGAKEVLNENYA